MKKLKKFRKIALGAVALCVIAVSSAPAMAVDKVSAVHAFPGFLVYTKTFLAMTGVNWQKRKDMNCPLLRCITSFLRPIDCIRFKFKLSHNKSSCVNTCQDERHQIKKRPITGRFYMVYSLSTATLYL